MKIEFLTDDNSLYVLPFFEEFLAHYASAFCITHISICPAMGKRSRTQLLRDLSALYGARGIARIMGRIARARLLGQLPLRRRSGRFYTLAQLCRAYQIPFELIRNPNAPSSVESMQRRAPDLVISVACPFILKHKILGIPVQGCINIHHASLPKYKGMMPTFWQMFHGENKVGMTIHYMNERVDEGSVLLRDEMAIHPGESLDNLIRRSKQRGAHCMARVLRKIEAGTQVAVPLEVSNENYFTFPSIGQIREFRQKGLRAL
jgi:methionyl-tRNA formyltransferase